MAEVSYVGATCLYSGNPVPSSTDLEGAPAGHPPAGSASSADHPLERTPPGGWTDVDRVPPARPADTSTYPSAQRYPSAPR